MPLLGSGDSYLVPLPQLVVAALPQATQLGKHSTDWMSTLTCPPQLGLHNHEWRPHLIHPEHFNIELQLQTHMRIDRSVLFLFNPWLLNQTVFLATQPERNKQPYSACKNCFCFLTCIQNEGLPMAGESQVA